MWRDWRRIQLIRASGMIGTHVQYTPIISEKVKLIRHWIPCLSVPGTSLPFLPFPFSFFHFSIFLFDFPPSHQTSIHSLSLSSVTFSLAWSSWCYHGLDWSWRFGEATPQESLRCLNFNWKATKTGLEIVVARSNCAINNHRTALYPKPAPFTFFLQVESFAWYSVLTVVTSASVPQQLHCEDTSNSSIDTTPSPTLHSFSSDSFGTGYKNTWNAGTWVPVESRQLVRDHNRTYGRALRWAARHRYHDFWQSDHDAMMALIVDLFSEYP